MMPRADQQRLYRASKRRAVLALLGGECGGCGQTDPRVLQIDHVKGGGKKDRAKHSNTTVFYQSILLLAGSGVDVSRIYQLLCANCNWIKRHERQEYAAD